GDRIIGRENCYLCIRFKVLPIYPLDTGRAMRGSTDLGVWPPHKPDQTLYRRYNLPPKVGAAPHPAAATFSP
ncbi:hypothetical protein, partial [Mesorhizobium sp.]